MEGLLSLSPTRQRPPKEQPVEPYSQEEMKKLIDVCDRDFAKGDKLLGSRHKAVILLFLDTGARLSELADMRLSYLKLYQP